ncbi:hypothetical protein [Brevibacillus sp. SYSU BS000544]|uniref:hypothetical protein n=1 Tax=Brevibacillus sp. SYSU BS000544 TaxID=3416443 RepID=UPI003CE58C7B
MDNENNRIDDIDAFAPREVVESSEKRKFFDVKWFWVIIVLSAITFIVFDIYIIINIIKVM